VEGDSSNTRPALLSSDKSIDSTQAPTALEASVNPVGEPDPIQEIPISMLDVHTPHETTRTWKDFFIHVAIITIGLLIAIGLEQTVALVHHRHLNQQLEQQMRAVFISDLQLDENNYKLLSDFRAYLVELRAAIDARVHGQSSVQSPSPNDSRMAVFLINPNLAPYESAKENGSVAWLASSSIRLYNRIALGRDLALAARDGWYEAAGAMQAFQEKFVDSPGSLMMGQIGTAPNLAVLSGAELTEYLTLVSAMVKKTDLVAARLHIFDVECRALLNGVRDENDLVKIIVRGASDGVDLTTMSPTTR
jgi:hypothetical protein